MIVVNTKELKEALRWVGMAVPKKCAIPILANVSLAEHNDKKLGKQLRIRATNLEISVERRIPATGTLAETLVPYSMIAPVTALAKSDTIEISEDAITAGIRVYYFEKTDLADYPCFPEADKPIHTFNESITDLLARVTPAVSGEVMRYALTGILFEVSRFGAYIVASDGKRLHRATVGKPDNKKFTSYVVQAETIQFLPKMALPLTIGVNKTKIVKGKAEDPTIVFFQSGSSSVAAQIVEGIFPNWRALWPKDEPAVSVRFNAGELTEEVRALSPAINWGRYSPPQIALGLAPDATALLLQVKTRETKADTRLSCSIKGSCLALATRYINSDHMREAVKAVAPNKDSTVIMEYRTPLLKDGKEVTCYPFVFSSEGSPVEAIVMPQEPPEEGGA